MRILLSNDDGIHAPGIRALHAAVLEFIKPEELLVVAPKTVQSATSHGVTFHEPLMTERVALDDGSTGYAVDGRPADCMKLALAELWPAKFGSGSRPDLVLSGMNAGANCGINVIYSGTVAAAIEAAFLGVPSIAVSLHLGKGEPDFQLGASQAARAIQRILSANLLEQHACLTVNVPRCESPPVDETEDPEADLPVVVCPMNTHGVIDRFEKRQSPGGQVYYWSAAHGLDFHTTDAGTDVEQLFARRITVTPLSFDLTDYRTLDAWRSALS